MESKNAYIKIRQDFYYKYSKYVVPALENYESERVQTLILTILLALILVIIGIVIFIIFIPLLQIGLFLIILGFIAIGMIKKNFERKIKKKIMPVVCGCFPKLKWRENNNSDFLYKILAYFNMQFNFSTLDIKPYHASNLISNYTIMYFDDCFDGEYNGVSFEIEENTAERSSEKNRVIVFKGVIITLNMNKTFKGNTVIKADSILHSSPNSKLHHTVLEDVEFEKKFDVFTDDDVEARYLITPTLMERLKSMQVAFKANSVSASFYQNKFYIALHTNKDLFALGSLTKKISDKEQFFTMFEEILSIIKLIDHFKLDQKIGM